MPAQRAFRPDAVDRLEARDVPSSLGSYTMSIRPAVDAFRAAAVQRAFAASSFTFNPTEYGSRFGYKPGSNFSAATFAGRTAILPTTRTVATSTATTPVASFGVSAAARTAASSSGAVAVSDPSTTYLFHTNSLSTNPLVLQHNASFVVNGEPAFLGGLR